MTSLPLLQSWLPAPESEFRPGWATLQLQENFLHVEATLSTVAPASTQARPDLPPGRTQRLWELGDTLEIFLQPPGQATYAELHLAPNLARSALLWPSVGAFFSAKSTGLPPEQFMAPDPHALLPAVQSDVAADGTQWHIRLTIPLTPLFAVPSPLVAPSASPWRVAVCRYDYGLHSGSPPVLSSTAPLTRPHFHHPEEWNSLFA